MKQEEKRRQDLTHILNHYVRGVPIKEIRSEFKIGYDTLYKALQGARIKPNRGKNKPRAERKEQYLTVHAPNQPGANSSGFVREHIMVATKALGRPLRNGEIVHHINGDKHDNRNVNLLICTQPYHVWLHWKMAELYQKEHFV